MSDRDILQKARTAKSGDKFRALYDSGDIAGYASQSNADQALMNLLAFWTRRDRGRMERLFSASALGRRDKWKSRADYRNMTLDRAIQDCTTIYEPDKKPAAVDFTVLNYKPEDYTDVGEALVLQNVANYAHPYSSWERGSNENGNRILLRFVPKGTDIGKLTPGELQQIEDWVNNYPRKLFEYKTANEMTA